MSRRRHFSIPPRTPFSRSRRLESNLRTIDPVRHFSSSLGLSGAGVAPLPPCSRKPLDETVKTFAVFPSWLHLFDGEDKCILSVPLSTSDLHYSCWQSGENCQVVSAGAFTLLCHVFLISMKGLFFFFFVVLSTRLSARCLLSFRPDTASNRSCLLLRPGFFDTREGGICVGSRACCFFCVFSIGSAFDGVWLLISGSHRVMSFHALLRLEGLAIT